MTLPAGYAEVRVDGTRAFVWHEARDWAMDTLEAHGTVHAWAAYRADARKLSGRGTVWSVPAARSGPDGRARWVVRRYLRGGAMAKVLHDTYLRAGPSRPLRELDASSAARDRGIAVPAVVAGIIHPAGPFRYRAELVTEMVPDATDLAGVLFGRRDTVGAPDGAAALHATGRLTRQAGAAGVLHPDFNAKNVVLRSSNDRRTGQDLQAWMVDLDRCRIRRTPRPEADTATMLARLERSLRKFERAGARRLRDVEWTALRSGAAGEAGLDGDDVEPGPSKGAR